MPIAKEPGKKRELAITRPKPNRNTIAVRPRKHVQMTKSEMYEDLRKAVENTK